MFIKDQCFKRKPIDKIIMIPIKMVFTVHVVKKKMANGNCLINLSVVVIILKMALLRPKFATLPNSFRTKNSHLKIFLMEAVQISGKVLISFHSVCFLAQQILNKPSSGSRGR